MLNQLPYLNFKSDSESASVFELSTHIVYLCPNLQDESPLEHSQNTSQLHHWLLNLIRRKNLEANKLKHTFVHGDFNSSSVSSIFIDINKSSFEQFTLYRKALKSLLKENPSVIHIVISPLWNTHDGIKATLQKLIYTLWVNSAPLPNRQKEHKPPKLNQINIYLNDLLIQEVTLKDFQTMGSIAEGNILTRALTMLPSNELTTKAYQEFVIQFAQKHKISYKTYDKNQLELLKAGAFLAVTQGNQDNQSSIIHLSYQSKKQDIHLKHISLVGKGVCFDTGGHQLKPAKYMQHMNQDMNGSAVALGILKAVVDLQLPVKLDVWLAIADNYLSSIAYKPQDVVTSLNGTTIEIIHTDAEGRMVLADTLTLASREKPEYLIDFATLTGSCVDAVGSIYSGLLSNNEEFTQIALNIAKLTGERLCAFPFDDDYNEMIESDIADIKQCTLESEADHILGAKFLQKFIDHEEQIKWCHIDLSASSNKDGLGAIESEVTGFGVHWGTTLINEIINHK